MADGQEITHEPTRRLFARSLKKDERGYFIAIGFETKRIQVEDTAYFVQRIDGSAAHGFELLLSDGTRETLAPKTLVYQPGRLTCKIKTGTEEAKFLHSSYIDLLKNLQEDESGYYMEFGTAPGTEKIQLSTK
jgi:hypothetical protein